jgi:hypothetical protein
LKEARSREVKRLQDERQTGDDSDTGSCIRAERRKKKGRKQDRGNREMSREERSLVTPRKIKEDRGRRIRVRSEVILNKHK